MKSLAIPSLLLSATLAWSCAPVPEPADPGPSTGTAGIYSLALDETGGAPARLTPLAIVEDSRCPADVQCIRAGTVKVRTRIARQGQGSESILELGEAQRAAGTWIELLRVCPTRFANAQIQPSAYRFTFIISEEPIAPDAHQQGPCPAT